MNNLSFVMEIMDRNMVSDKITKPECMEYIKNYGTPYVMTMQPELIAYMCGYKYTDGKLTKGQFKPSSDYTEDLLTPFYVYAFLPIVEFVQEYQLWNYKSKLKGRKAEKEELRMMPVLDKVFRHNNHLVRAWKDVATCYQLASNGVIYYELLRCYGYFYGMFESYRNFCKKHLKSEPELVKSYQFILGDGLTLDNPFHVALEDTINVCCGVKYQAKIPCDLTNSKKTFWDSYKKAKKDFKEYTENE